MKLRKLLSTLVIAAVSTIASVVAGGTANATTWDHVWKTTDDNPGGTVYIKENGDTVKVCDTDADGYWAEAFYSFQDGTHPTEMLLSASGHGNCETASASDVDIPENEWVTVTVALYHNSDRNSHFASTH